MRVTKPHKFSIDAMNRASESQAVAILDRIVERSVWLAQRAVAARPFRDVAHLADWLDAEVRSLPRDEAIQLLCAHPELSPPDPTAVTRASQLEQGRLQLLEADTDLSTQLADLNRQYQRIHGYPFVIALHAQSSIGGVIAEFKDRLAAAPDDELARSLGEVISVMRARLAELSGVKASGTQTQGSNSQPCTASQEADE